MKAYAAREAQLEDGVAHARQAQQRVEPIGVDGDSAPAAAVQQHLDRAAAVEHEVDVAREEAQAW